MTTDKYLLVWERMGNYHVARWRALQHRVGKENAYAADLAAGDNLYGWKADWAEDPQYSRLSDRKMEEGDLWTRFSAFKKLVKGENITTVAIAGYYRPELIAMLIWSKLTGRTVVLFAESWYGGNALLDKAKGLMLNTLCHLFFVSGSRAEKHFAGRLAIPARKIKKGYSVVDNTFFEQARALRQANRGLKKTILCVARFSPEKNLLMLLQAFANSGLAAKGWKLRIVGGGPQKAELETLFKQIAGVELQDWVQHQELPQLYAEASIFVLPSTFEPWGLVVNEAISAGLYCICSEAVGAAPDLITPENGLLFEEEHMQSLIDSIVKGSRWAEAGDLKIKELAAPYTLGAWAETIANAAKRQ